VQQYQRNPPIVTAEQFAATITPWPDGVDQCDLMPDAAHCHAGAGALLRVADSDWIVTDDGGARTVLDDVTFRARYTIKA